MALTLRRSLRIGFPGRDELGDGASQRLPTEDKLYFRAVSGQRPDGIAGRAGGADIAADGGGGF